MQIDIDRQHLNGSIYVVGDSSSLYRFQLPPTFNPVGSLASFTAGSGSLMIGEFSDN